MMLSFSHTTHCRFRAVVMLSSGPGPLLNLVTPRPKPHIEWSEYYGHSGRARPWLVQTKVSTEAGLAEWRAGGAI